MIENVHRYDMCRPNHFWNVLQRVIKSWEQKKKKNSNLPVNTVTYWKIIQPKKREKTFNKKF